MFLWLKKLVYGDQPSQLDYVDWWVNDLIHEGNRLDQEVGVVLMTKLPGAMAQVLPETSFNPFLIYSTTEMYYWLIDHIFFGKDGKPMVLHDKGRLVWAGRHFNEAAWLKHKDYHYGR